MKKQDFAQENALREHLKRDWRFAHGIWTGVKSAVWGQPIFRCYLTSNQDNITDSTVTTIQFDTISFDRVGAGLSGYGYPVSRPGIYYAMLSVFWKTLPTDGRFKTLIYLNSTLQANTQGHSSTANNFCPPPAIDFIEADEGDIIYGKVQHLCGTNDLDIVGTSTGTRMVIGFVGDKVS